VYRTADISALSRIRQRRYIYQLFGALIGMVLYYKIKGRKTNISNEKRKKKNRRKLKLNFASASVYTFIQASLLES